jgi:hypothetical protein
LQEAVRLYAERMTVHTTENFVCEVILNHFIPCIVGDQIDLKKFYTRLEILQNTHSENSMESQEFENSIDDNEERESYREKDTF